jgi:hypothetical protein
VVFKIIQDAALVGVVVVVVVVEADCQLKWMHLDNNT